ncbi:fumarylacetoacetate hydrolase family protein [Simiduia aestuariiviva]|uniref:2-keto-4-pentenoate hydratase/2-oxohepta-3-ene-1,7-dioic acid hydratase in catechol pathway n=1 Tax=Simiduia aestuariiviva TaxID=1510459 RepID=A0A839UHM9_9GAMM|nr:fumarylacetoacetate hydrolase family protein [Simiduia aestuariiviva]MBB3166973.1 2-keto-4-pentenoate hydratase/2-oxohepta-3-ene-1,7-dioic acid hydratase in catechol pathway [Simiduia aestuariiviva]
MSHASQYQHRFTGPEEFQARMARLPLGKILCVGQNYADHIAEMNSKVSAEPLLFIKTAICACPMEDGFTVPTQWGSCHFETEMSVLIDRPLSRANETQAREAVAAVGLAFDLTLRELQSALKAKGHPWEKAKGFTGSAPLSHFVPAPEDLQSLDLRLTQNGAVRQQGNTRAMLTPVAQLLAYASQFFDLQPGDVLLTGTPAGVGPLASGDQLVAELGDLLRVSCQVR